MNKIWILVFTIIIVTSCEITDNKEVKQVNELEVIIPGSLSSLLSVDDLQTKTKLIITGKIDARDFVILRDFMPQLEELDLSDALIYAYSGKGGTEIEEDEDYPSQTIPSSAFYKKTILKKIILPTSLKALSVQAFSGCSGLATIEIPESVIDMGFYTFEYCTSLTTINIPSNVTIIDEGTFRNCTNLNSIIIPASVNTIVNTAFRDSPNISTITIYAANPPKTSGIIEGLDTYFFAPEVYSRCTLYVPKNAKTLYQTANIWKDFKNIVEM